MLTGDNSCSGVKNEIACSNYGGNCSKVPMAVELDEAQSEWPTEEQQWSQELAQRFRKGIWMDARDSTYNRSSQGIGGHKMDDAPVITKYEWGQE